MVKNVKYINSQQYTGTQTAFNKQRSLTLFPSNVKQLHLTLFHCQQADKYNYNLKNLFCSKHCSNCLACSIT